MAGANLEQLGRIGQICDKSQDVSNSQIKSILILLATCVKELSVKVEEGALKNLSAINQTQNINSAHFYQHIKEIEETMHNKNCKLDAKIDDSILSLKQLCVNFESRCGKVNEEFENQLAKLKNQLQQKCRSVTREAKLFALKNDDERDNMLKSLQKKLKLLQKDLQEFNQTVWEEFEKVRLQCDSQIAKISSLMAQDKILPQKQKKSHSKLQSKKNSTDKQYPKILKMLENNSFSQGQEISAKKANSSAKKQKRKQHQSIQVKSIPIDIKMKKASKQAKKAKILSEMKRIFGEADSKTYITFIEDHIKLKEDQIIELFFRKALKGLMIDD